MAGDKLNLSLDEILTERRKSVRKPRGVRRPAAGGKAPAVAPVGGVKKPTKSAKGIEKSTVPTGPSGSGESKIIVSNLPMDVTETNIKEYFTKTIGPIKKVLLTYGPNGQSRGVATITFSKSDGAAIAAKKCDGLKVDNRPMKVEVILGAKDAPLPPTAKKLGDRIAQPKPAQKVQPKPATETKARDGKTAGRGRGKRGRNAGRGKPKTAQELDAEMVDYFDNGSGGATAAGGDTAMATNGGSVQPTATGGETAMVEDEIM